MDQRGRSAARPLADEFVLLYESPDPARVYCHTPGLCLLPGGRLVATLDLGGPGVASLPGPKCQHLGGCWQGRVFTSDDRGRTWQQRTGFPFLHARPFVAGGSVYVLGQADDLNVIRSDDAGETWSQPSPLTQGQHWHQSACNVHYAHGCVYLVMERRMTRDILVWPVGEMAPVLMRAAADTDLTRRESWTFASELSFRDVIPQSETEPAIDFFGVPFYPCPYPVGSTVALGRNCAPIGWLETNVVQLVDPDHYWYDSAGRTFHLWMRAHTGITGLAAICKVIEGEGGDMTTTLETAPSGRKMLYVPCPGGQMRFHILYDEPTKLYWLLSTQATDSMTRADRLPPDRFNLPNNERRRLQLHFSRNCIDWCFAGLVAMGPVEKASRHYASMVIDGDDLHVLSRSGDERAHNPHDGNLITFHTIRDFRGLIY